MVDKKQKLSSPKRGWMKKQEGVVKNSLLLAVLLGTTLTVGYLFISSIPPIQRYTFWFNLIMMFL